jgi:hypothetical protein
VEFSERASEALVPTEDVKPPEAETEMRVIRILPGSRYAIVVPETASIADCQRYADHLTRWADQDSVFCVIRGVKLVRLTDPLGLAEADDDDGG